MTPAHRPLICPAVPMDLDTMCSKDLARTAHLVVDALRNAPETAAPVDLDTEFGPATVHRDGEGADVVLDDRDATVHVRID